MSWIDYDSPPPSNDYVSWRSLDLASARHEVEAFVARAERGYPVRRDDEPKVPVRTIEAAASGRLTPVTLTEEQCQAAVDRLTRWRRKKPAQPAHKPRRAAPPPPVAPAPDPDLWDTYVRNGYQWADLEALLR